MRVVEMMNHLAQFPGDMDMKEVPAPIEAQPDPPKTEEAHDGDPVPTT